VNIDRRKPPPWFVPAVLFGMVAFSSVLAVIFASAMQ
jgi:hypothetical protein